MGNDGSRDIKPPLKAPIRAAARSIAEAVAALAPGMGIVNAINRVRIPPVEEKDRRRWAEEVTGRVNEHDRALNPQRTITGATAALAVWLTEQSQSGLDDPDVDLTDLVAALGGEHPLHLIEEAADELEKHGMVKVRRHFGGGSVHPTWMLFANMDVHAKGWDTLEDARTLARLALETGDSVSAPDLERRSGFERRRFNPAFTYLLVTFFEPNLVSRTLQPDYYALHAFMSPGTRREVRAFAAGAA